jgi:effector-binding domain-containing protein
MPPSCCVVSLSPVLLALTQEELPRGQIPKRIRGMFDVVYSWLKTADVRQAGHNYAVYDKGSTQDLLVRVGFPVSGRFIDTERVQCVELAGGDAAHATHVGAYGELHRTYAALTEWCARTSVPLSGQSWEVYGDWHHDPSKLETDIYFRLGAGR